MTIRQIYIDQLVRRVIRRYRAGGLICKHLDTCGMCQWCIRTETIALWRDHADR